MRSGRLLNSFTPYTWNAVLGGRSQLNFLGIRALLFCPLFKHKQLARVNHSDKCPSREGR